MKKNIVIKAALFLLSMSLVAGIYTFIVIPSVKKDDATEMYEIIKIIESEGRDYGN